MLVLSAASQAGWLAKHAPETADSLAMHAKKVQEIRGWLELQRQPGLQCPAPRMLLLSGEACGRAPPCLALGLVAALAVLHRVIKGVWSNGRDVFCERAQCYWYREIL